MGQNSSTSIREPIENLHSEVMRHGGAEYDLVTSSTISYPQFLSYITRLNHICHEFKDSEGRVLVFAVKKGSDSTIFWKMTVRIACVKLDSTSNSVLSHRLLSIRQFLQVFRRITYEHTQGLLDDNGPTQSSESHLSSSRPRLPPTLATSIVLGETPENGQEASASNSDPSCLEECVICLERKPDVILPCAHAYCLPCIEQWWEYCIPSKDECDSGLLVLATNGVDKTCPVCRESLSSTDDTWVISDKPDDKLVNAELRQALMGLAESEKDEFT